MIFGFGKCSITWDENMHRTRPCNSPTESIVVHPSFFLEYSARGLLISYETTSNPAFLNCQLPYPQEEPKSKIVSPLLRPTALSTFMYSPKSLAEPAKRFEQSAARTSSEGQSVVNPCE